VSVFKIQLANFHIILLEDDYYIYFSIRKLTFQYLQFAGLLVYFQQLILLSYFSVLHVLVFYNFNL